MAGVLAAFLSLAAAGTAKGDPTLAALTREGSALMAEGRLEAALGAFRQALELRPNDPALEFNVGLTLFQMGRFGEAIEPLRRARAHPPSAPQARFLLGVALYESGDLAAATPELEASRAHSELGEKALYMLVEIHRHAGEAERAQAAFLDLQRRYPGSAFYHKLMGAAYDAEGMHAEALQEFQAARQKDPRMPEIAFAIGFMHFKRRELGHAAKWLQDELAVQPCHAGAHHYLGEIESARGRAPGAEARYRRAIACDASYAAAQAGLGALLVAEGRFEEALGPLGKAVELEPNGADAHYALGRALLRLGRREDAGAAFRRVDEIHAARHETARRALGRTGQAP